MVFKIVFDEEGRRDQHGDKHYIYYTIVITFNVIKVDFSDAIKSLRAGKAFVCRVQLINLYSQCFVLYVFALSPFDFVFVNKRKQTPLSPWIYITSLISSQTNR